MMKNKLMFSFFFLSMALSCLSQINLVNNPSFEIYDDSCLAPGQNITQAKFWFQPNQWDWPNGGADFYHTNTCDPNYSPPSLGGWGYQFARTGNGFGGAGVCVQNQNLYREYMEVSLNEELDAGKKYCTFFYTTNSKILGYGASDCVQLLFSSDSLMYHGVSWEYYPSSPDIQNKLGNIITEGSIITDTSNWVLINGIYSAVGGEKFITIGCFSPREEISFYCPNGSGNCGYAYYYFDDFGIYELPEIEAGNNDSICNNGDSVQLNANCTGCWPGLEYRWWPATGINDTTILNPTASPTITTTYYFGLIDTSNTVPCIVDLIDSLTIFVCDSAGNSPPSTNTGFVFNIYPNPAQATVTLNFESLQENVMMFIYDARGRLVLKQAIVKGTKKKELNIADFASGMYLITIQNSEIKETIKFVKT